MLWNLLIVWLKKANTALMFENHFNKELVMRKKYNKDFKDST